MTIASLTKSYCVRQNVSRSLCGWFEVICINEMLATDCGSATWYKVLKLPIWNYICWAVYLDHNSQGILECLGSELWSGDLGHVWVQRWRTGYIEKRNKNRKMQCFERSKKFSAWLASLTPAKHFNSKKNKSRNHSRLTQIILYRENHSICALCKKMDVDK